MKVRGDLDIYGSSIKIAHFREQQSSGVDSSDSLTADAWNTRTLNTTVSNSIRGCTLSANRITLLSGKYFIQATCTHYDEDSFSTARIQDITNSATLIVGPTIYNDNVSGQLTMEAPVRGVIIVGNTIEIELQHFPDNGGVGSGGNAAGITNVNEVYSELIIWKI
jgi:hypothetical protein